MDTDMDYDSIAKAGSMLGSGAVIVMDDTRCMVRSLERLSYFYLHESCGQCTPCREGTGWLYRVVAPHRARARAGRRTSTCSIRWPTTSRAARSAPWATPRRCRCAPSSSTSGPSSSTISSTSAAWLRTPCETMIELEIDGRKVAVPDGSMVMDAADRAGHLRSALLLSPQAVDRGQLPHVPGRHREGAQADAGLRHAGDARHDRAHRQRPRHAGAARGDGVPADQPPARLPDLRPGRRVPVAGPGGRLRRRRFALPGREARRLPQEPGPAGVDGGDERAASIARAACASARRWPA